MTTLTATVAMYAGWECYRQFFGGFACSKCQ